MSDFNLLEHLAEMLATQVNSLRSDIHRIELANQEAIAKKSEELKVAFISLREEISKRALDIEWQIKTQSERCDAGYKRVETMVQDKGNGFPAKKYKKYLLQVGVGGGWGAMIIEGIKAIKDHWK